MKKAMILSLTILWYATGAVIASDYHVAQKDRAADDRNPGTADKPFKTINAAFAGNRLKPGDTLYVHQGVYRESVELSCANAHQGEPGAHIRILAWPREVVEIKGSDVVADWRRYDGGTSAAPAPTPVSKGKIYVKEDWGHNTLENMEVCYADFCGISVGGSFNTLIRCKSNHNGNTGISTFNRGHRVIDCEVRFNNRRRWSANWHAGGMKNFSSDTVISGCVAEGNVESPGIWFDGSNTAVTIENCRCFRNGLGIMYEIGERAIIKNNICYENSGRGIYISNSAYCSIVHNLCYRNGMSGIVVIGVEREGGTVGDDETGYTPARGNIVWGNVLVDNCYPGLAIKGWKGRPELILPDERIKSNVGNVSDYNIFYRTAIA